MVESEARISLTKLSKRCKGPRLNFGYISMLKFSGWRNLFLHNVDSSYFQQFCRLLQIVSENLNVLRILHILWPTFHNRHQNLTMNLNQFSPSDQQNNIPSKILKAFVPWHSFWWGLKNSLSDIIVARYFYLEYMCVMWNSADFEKTKPAPMCRDSNTIFTQQIVLSDRK